uniref:DUF4939 domain-containing protein n=1 Tax=Amphiprion ocellaris TaxID=80972 RepID=A0A3Q1BD71_AMPOC
LVNKLLNFYSVCLSQLSTPTVSAPVQLSTPGSSVSISLDFEMQPLSYSSNRACVAYLLSLLKGMAKEWGVAMWKSRSEVCKSYNAFITEMRKSGSEDREGIICKYKGE